MEYSDSRMFTIMVLTCEAEIIFQVYDNTEISATLTALSKSFSTHP